jgi:FMN phosphatase YigB (HAD superfamily)
MGIDCVVFDLGGVLVELGGVRDFGDMIGEPDDEQVWAQWLTNTWVRDYERGLCSSETFASGMVEQFDLETSAEEFIERFRAWPRGLFAGAYGLVEDLSSSVRVACLSNTNEVHWSRQADALRLAELFPTRFLSHELGLIKPDREIYDHVAERLDISASSILFFDDNQLNVDAARAAGWQAVRIQGPEEARACLAEHELVVP